MNLFLRMLLFLFIAYFTIFSVSWLVLLRMGFIRFIAYFTIFSVSWLVLLRMGFIRFIRPVRTALEEAKDFLSKWLSREDQVAIGPSAMSSVIKRVYYWWIIFGYETKFHEYPPLFNSLFNFKKDNPFSLEKLLQYFSPIFLWAIRKEGISKLINPHLKLENALMTFGSEKSNGSFLSKSDFYHKFNEYIKTDVGSMDLFTGEFGVLRDQEFLDALKECKRSTANIIGCIEGNPSKIDEALDKLYKINTKKEKSPHKYTNREAKKQEKKSLVKQLVKSKKLSIFITPERPEVIHMYRIGEAVYIQQLHAHNDNHDETSSQTPVAVILVKKPSKNLKRFANDYLKEFRESLSLTELK